MKGKMIAVIMLISLLCLVGIYTVYQKISEKADTWLSFETYQNVYIFSGKDKELVFLKSGKKVKLSLTYPLTQEIKNCIGDIDISDGVVTTVRIKPDQIKGKVLSVSKTAVEIEGYGEFPFAEKSKIYQLSQGEDEIDTDTKVMEATDKNITVGFDQAIFVVANTQICGVIVPQQVITKDQKTVNIRVAVKTDGFADYIHKKVVVTSKKSFTVTIKDKKKTYKAGEKAELSGDQRIKVSGEDRIQLLSVKRNGKCPSYRGTIEVRKRGDCYVIVNDLSIEEYLYAVVPSEMPTSYGKESLMVQSVCARSYAYQQILENDLREYGAHVDDSVSYQVYNNTPENKESIEAVNATKGKILKLGKKVACTYFFSTSCGHTTNALDTGFSTSNVKYLTGQSQKEDGKDIADLSNETQFKKFITENKDATYDSSYPWYRWSVVLPKSKITANINASLSKRISVNPGRILVKNDKGSFVSQSINTVGQVKSVIVRKRGTGGVITCLEIVGSEHTIRINNEYNCRLFLAPGSTPITRKDNSKIPGLTLLPSGFFVTEDAKDNIKISGGGYGHGVGMSQNGVKRMAQLGKTYDKILSHYYPGTTLSTY